MQISLLLVYLLDRLVNPLYVHVCILNYFRTLIQSFTRKTKLEGVNMLVSIQLKEELQVSLLLLIYEQLLLFFWKE
jgi:hypothetical protein